jgi:hypothetical protein
MSSKDATMQELAHLIDKIKPLVEKLLSDAFSAEDRRQFRRIVGVEKHFITVTMMNALCSETARRRLRGETLAFGKEM